MKTCQLALLVVLICVASVPIQQATAKDAPGCKLIEKTIYVPKLVYETRKVKCVECRPQIEEFIETVDKTVTEIRMEERTETIKVPEFRYRIENCTVQKPQFEERTECYTKSVATEVKWKGTESVVKEVPQKITRVITEDKGHWEERCCESCGKCKKKECCCSQPRTRRVWVPNLVKRTVEDTVMKKVTEEVPATYKKTCYQTVPATRTKLCFTCYKPETIQNKVKYTAYVCREVTKQVPVPVTKTIQVKKSRTRTVMVPHTIEKEIEVPVCTLVPTTITCKVPTVSSCLEYCRPFWKACPE